MATWPSDSVRTKNWGTEVLTDSDLEAQFDLLHAYLQAALHATTGHDHSGTSNDGPKIPINSGLTIASQAQGDIIYATSASAWARLAKGTATQILKMNAGATAPEWVSGNLWSELPDGAVVQVVNTITGAVATGSTTMPYDDTIPQITEGDQYMTLAITPKATTNKLLIQVVLYVTNTATDYQIAALFQDATANALAAGVEPIQSGGFPKLIAFNHYMAAGTTSATTFRVRSGNNSAGTTTFNGSAGGRLMGGIMASSITITEIKSA